MTTSDPREPAPAPPAFDEFYIGYAPPMPPQTARFVKRAVLTIAAGVPLAASLIAIGHVRLDGGTFDYGRPQTIAGVITTRPYPFVDIEPSGKAGSGSRALLVAPGKHGADAIAAPFEGQRVTFEATRIQRGGAAMFEIAPGSIAANLASADDTKPSEAEGPKDTPPSRRARGGQEGEWGSNSRSRAALTLRGEIVDSKCFLGVMVPGEGKTHKDCASLCLRGGIPPALVVRDRDGRTALLLLVSESGGSLAGHAAVSRLAGEPVEMTGVIEDRITPSAAKEPGWRVLRTTPSAWRPLGTPAR